jgi:hypothetical protein
MSRNDARSETPPGTRDKDGWYNHGHGTKSRFMPEARIDGRMTEEEHIRLSRGEMSQGEHAKILARPLPRTGARPASATGARPVPGTGARKVSGGEKAKGVKKKR